jgi:predicted Zn-dependent protease
MIRLIPKFLLFLFIWNCATSPTGRRQFIMIDDSDMNVMGAEAFEDIKKQTPIETNTAINNYVKCITFASLKETQDTTGVTQWEVVVFRDSSINAFALPGGKIGVYTGIMTIADNQDKLAAVIGHEIAHVTARHGNERVSQSSVTQGGLSVLQGMGYETAAGALGAGATYGVILPFSRKHETEADVIGLEIMSKAGFNPQESVSLWQGMKAASGGGKPPEIVSTHPSDDRRIKDLQDKMPQALINFNSARQAGKKPNCKI